MQIIFILVEPQYPENVGAAARAIKTMGFTDIRLVNPCDYLSKEAQWLAHGSIDMLENAKTFSSLEEAVKDIDFVIATTSKKRKTNFNYHLPENLSQIITEKGSSIKSVGVLFGREDLGLSNNDLKLADIISTVPIKCAYPSLNLAQSIMIYAYELSCVQKDESKDETDNEFKYKLLKAKTDNILTKVNIKADSNLYNRIFERLALTTQEDINLMLSVTKKLLEEMED